MKRLTACLVLLALSLSTRAEEAPQVFLDNDELNYVGSISRAGATELSTLYARLDRKPTILAIRSRGGDTAAGMALGTLVHAHGLTVKVMEYCLSSCANYVFTAAPYKIVSNFAMIGYHGGLSSDTFALDPAQEARFAAMPAAEQAAARKRYDAEMRRDLAGRAQEERRFFDMIKVEQRITTLGQAPQYQQRFRADEKLVAWTFSLDGFAALGVRNIRVVNPPWQPKSVKSDYGLLQIDVP